MRLLYRVLFGAFAVALASLAPGPGRAQGSAPVTIEYWHINSESFGGPTVRKFVAEFERANPGIHVVERFQQNSYSGLLQNLQRRLAAGDPPDVTQFGDPYIFYAIDNLADRFTPLADLVAKYGPKNFFSNFPPNVLALGQANGKQVAVPYSTSNIVLYYNADMFRAAGLDPNRPPETWPQWITAARQIKTKTGKPGLYLHILDDNWGFQAMFESNGAQLYRCQAGVVRAGFDEPGAIQALKFWQAGVKDGIFLNALYEQGRQGFLNQQNATFMGTIATRGYFQDNAKFDVRGTLFPSWPGHKRRLPAGGNLLFVFSKDPAKQAASMKWIAFLESPKNFAEWTKATGYLPLPKGTVDQLGDWLNQNAIERVAIAQIPYVVNDVSFPGPNGLQAMHVLFDAVQGALNGADAEAALHGAAQQVNGLLGNTSCK
ncbi:MAG: ABC transporter substrate-binding protein [Candidatus Eremiobacteraeota bacterium]|nr:ABC transporter substrate-binding protein [Candidatus Eremiobacteraeota bacterium]